MPDQPQRPQRQRSSILRLGRRSTKTSTSEATAADDGASSTSNHKEKEEENTARLGDSSRTTDNSLEATTTSVTVSQVATSKQRKSRQVKEEKHTLERNRRKNDIKLSLARFGGFEASAEFRVEYDPSDMMAGTATATKKSPKSKSKHLQENDKEISPATPNPISQEKSRLRLQNIFRKSKKNPSSSLSVQSVEQQASFHSPNNKEALNRLAIKKDPHVYNPNPGCDSETRSSNSWGVAEYPHLQNFPATPKTPKSILRASNSVSKEVDPHQDPHHPSLTPKSTIKSSPPQRSPNTTTTTTTTTTRGRQAPLRMSSAPLTPVHRRLPPRTSSSSSWDGWVSPSPSVISPSYISTGRRRDSQFSRKLHHRRDHNNSTTATTASPTTVAQQQEQQVVTQQQEQALEIILQRVLERYPRKACRTFADHHLSASEELAQQQHSMQLQMRMSKSKFQHLQGILDEKLVAHLHLNLEQDAEDIVTDNSHKINGKDNDESSTTLTKPSSSRVLRPPSQHNLTGGIVIPPRHHHSNPQEETKTTTTTTDAVDNNNSNGMVVHLLVPVQNINLLDPSGNSAKYTGTIDSITGKPCGHGRLESSSPSSGSTSSLLCLYEGEWMDGYWSGRGRQQFQDNADVYEGAFLDNVKHGLGIYTYSNDHENQRVFEGRHVMGQRVEGTMTYIDGSVYRGQWYNGKRHGRGTYTFSNGSVYKGDFFLDKMQGAGQLIWPDGGRFVGEWSGDKRHGIGKEFLACGTIRHEGFWRNGVHTPPTITINK
jgi:hypothetical protein